MPFCMEVANPSLPMFLAGVQGLERTGIRARYMQKLRCLALTARCDLLLVVTRGEYSEPVTRRAQDGRKGYFPIIF